MFKKITSLIMVFLLCCLTPIAAFSEAAPLLVEENDVSITQDDHDHQTLEERMALHPEIAIIAEKNNIDPEAIYFSSASQERLDAYYGAPDDILSSSTLELLVYFIEDTCFMTNVAVPEIFAASPDIAEREKNRKVDFTRHAAFRELISRDDFIDALEIYAASLTQLTYDDDPFDMCKKAIKKILEQSTVEALLSDPTYNAYTHPNIQRIRGASEAVTTSVSEYASSTDSIYYYSAGTISTVNGRKFRFTLPTVN